MNKFIIYLMLPLFLIIGCGGMTGGLKVLPEPESDNVIVLGCVLIENINLGYSFSNWDLPVKVVIIGRGIDGSIRDYEVNSDVNGYYCLPNVPKGSYFIKALIFQEPGSKPEVILNEKQTGSADWYRMRHPERGFEKTTDSFPPVAKSNIINMNILWFGLKTAAVQDLSEIYAGEVLTAKFKNGIDTERMWDNGYPYSRMDPVIFYREKFPVSSWWTR